VIRHVYIERRMIPLNIYLQEATPEQIAAVVVEYGNAIKDLVRANIFPGDMLWKNFGVTRHGKVVFYDYDEIEYLTECNFSKVPEARNEEDEMSGEVWYKVGPKDVFPETFGPFLLGNPAVREVFMAHHADLLDSAFWQGHKQDILAGYVHDVFPYDAQKRFALRVGRNDFRKQGEVPWQIPSSSSRPRARHRRHARRFQRARRAPTRQRRDQGRGRARRRHRRRRQRGADGQLPDGRPGPGAGAPGDARRRAAAVGRRGDVSKMCGSGCAR
jgi:hypothetical protein